MDVSMATAAHKDPQPGMVQVVVTYTTYLHPEDLQEHRYDLLSTLADFQGDPYASYLHVDPVDPHETIEIKSPEVQKSALEAIRSRLEHEKEVQKRLGLLNQTKIPASSSE